jgi:hypothetical protein
MALLKSTFILALVASAFGQNCSSNAYNCPATGSFNVCAGDSLKTNIIIRCVDGCPQPGNCNDNLAGVPPVGVKVNALCYQDSATAGNAACTFNCVSVQKLDGSIFYPVGCTTASSSSSTASSTSSSKTTYWSSATSGSASVKTSSHTSYVQSHNLTYISPTISATGGSGGNGGNGGHGGGVTSSTTYFTTTLPGGSVSVGSSVVVSTSTSTPPVLSNDGNGFKAEGFVVLLLSGLIALF